MRGGRVLKPVNRGNGYYHVGLWRDGHGKLYYIHRLVLLAFVGPCPEGLEALHGPAGTSDNSLTNLRWGTREQNQRDRVRDKTSNDGERNPAVKLTTAKVQEILSRRGENQRLLAAEYGISQGHVSDILNRKKRKHG